MSDSTLPLKASQHSKQRTTSLVWSQPVMASKLVLSLAYGLILLGFTQALQWL